jgi:hypothetical protein
MELIDYSASSSAWFKIFVEEDIKQYVVHKSLLTDTISNLLSLGFTVESIEQVDYLPFDLGGSIMMGMPKETIRLDLLTIDLWSHQVAGVAQFLDTHIDNIRVFQSNKKYYKVHNTFWCLIMSKEQFDMFKTACYDLSLEAENNFQDFMSSHKTK